MFWVGVTVHSGPHQSLAARALPVRVDAKFPTGQLGRGESSPLLHSRGSTPCGVGSPTTAACTCSKPEAVHRDALELKSCPPLLFLPLYSLLHFLCSPPLSWSSSPSPKALSLLTFLPLPSATPPSLPLLPSPLFPHSLSPFFFLFPWSLSGPQAPTQPHSPDVVLTLQQLGLTLSALL